MRMTKALSLTNEELINAIPGLTDLDSTPEEMCAVNVESHKSMINREVAFNEFKTFMKKFNPTHDNHKEIICGLAIFIYMNGISNSLPGTLKIGKYSWKDYRDKMSDARISKQNVLRSMTMAVREIHITNTGIRPNFFVESCEKYGIALDAIPSDLQYYGANYNI